MPGKPGQDCPRLKGLNILILPKKTLAQSKAIRNAILQVKPRWMIEKLIALAKDSQLQSINEELNIVEARSKIVDFFYDYGISPERCVERYEKRN